MRFSYSLNISYIFQIALNCIIILHKIIKNNFQKRIEYDSILLYLNHARLLNVN